MIVDDTHVEYFNNRLYVHICTFKYRGELVYYFSDLYNQLFCTKNDGVYQPITDNYKYWLYRNVFGLVNPLGKYKLADVNYSQILEKINHITGVIRYGRGYEEKYNLYYPRVEKEEEDKYKSELIENLKSMKEKLGLDLDIEKIQNAISKVEYRKMPDEVGAMGLAVSDRQVYLKNNARETSVLGRKVRNHEGIHLVTGKNAIRYHLFQARGLLEGETESLNNDYFGFNGSHSEVFYDMESGTTKRQTYNLADIVSYKECVSLVKQMEVALGKKSHDSILKGDMSFERDFIKQYGLIPYIKLSSSMQILSNPIFLKNDQEKKSMGILKKAQNDLLKVVFNKDFAKVQTSQDAVEFLRKLRSFDLVRMREYQSINGIETEDPTYRNYYIEMHSKVKQKLMTLGYTEAQINQDLEGLEYKQQRFNKNRTGPEVEFNGSMNRCTELLLSGANLTPEECKFIRISDIDGICGFHIIKNNKLLMEKRVLKEDGKGYERVIEEHDIDRIKQEWEKRGIEISELNVDKKKVIENANEKATEIRIKKEEAEKKATEQQMNTNEKEQTNQEQALTPYKRNIFQKLFDRIKETFNRRKDEIEPEQPQDAFEKTEQKKEEERRPSWDLRNWGMTRASLQKQQPTQTQARNIENQRSVGARPMDDGPEK